MAGFVYILYSEKWKQYYVGSTQDVEVRIAQHNSGRTVSTRGGAPWVVKYREIFEEIATARRREYAIKKKKSRKHLEELIAGAKG